MEKVLSEKQTVAQLISKFPSFRGTQKFVLNFTYIM